VPAYRENGGVRDRPAPPDRACPAIGGKDVSVAEAETVTIEVPTAAAMRDLGHRLAEVVRAGDLLVLSGELGAGKTTLTQGIGAGMGVRGPITSPTFVIARVHPPLGAGPPLVHADAYRLGGLAEIDDLDLDASVDDAVTVVEWGAGLVEELAEDRLEVVISRGEGETGETRAVALVGVGPRWAAVIDRFARASGTRGPSEGR
jgi:tRNA threonylcarbamoyladenosine biosynthesis protein TsaE